MSVLMNPSASASAAGAATSSAAASAAANPGIFGRVVAVLADPQRLLYIPLQSGLEYAGLAEKTCHLLSRATAGMLTVLGSCYLGYHSLVKKKRDLDEQQKQYRQYRETIRPRVTELMKRHQSTEAALLYSNHKTVVELNKECKEFFEECKNEKERLSTVITQNPVRNSLLKVTPLVTSLFFLSPFIGWGSALLALGSCGVAVWHNLKEKHQATEQYTFLCSQHSEIKNEVYSTVSSSTIGSALTSMIRGKNYEFMQTPTGLDLDKYTRPPRSEDDIEVNLNNILNRVNKRLGQTDLKRQTRCRTIQTEIKHQIFYEIQNGDIDSPASMLKRKEQLLEEKITAENKARSFF